MAERTDSASAGTGKLKIFISYSRRDLAAADALVGALEAHGFEVVIDRRDLPYGELWQAELADFIRGADTVVWLVSPSSVGSKWCNWELGEVQRLSKRLLPVVVEPVAPEVLPEALGKIHLLPAQGAYESAAHLPLLVAAINTDRGWVKDATRLADRARQWLVKERDAGLLLRGAALKDAEQWSTRKPSAAPAPASEILELILASRRGAARRQRWAVGGALSVAALSSLLALWAFTERQRATSNEALAIRRAQEAERNYGFAIDATENLAVGLARDVRGFTGVRRERIKALLERAENVYATLRTAGATARLEQSEAAMLQEAAATYAELGSLPEARQRAERAVALVRKQNSNTSDEAEHRRELAGALSGLVKILSQQGAMEPMRAAVEEMIALWRRNAAGTAKSPEGRRELANGLRSVALYFVPADRPQARTYLGEAASIFQELGTKNATVDNLLDSWRCTHDFAVVVWGEGDMALAKTSFQFLSTLGRMAIHQYPGDMRVQHAQMRALQRFSDLSSLMREPEPAAAAEVEALEIARDLLKSEPGNYQAQLDEAFSLQRVAGLKLDLDKRDEAKTAAIQAREAASRLTRLDPSNSGAYELLGRTLQQVGYVLSQLGETAAALGSYEEALTIARRRVGDDPTDARAQSAYADTLFQFAGLSKDKSSRAEVEEGVGILRRLKKDGTLGPAAEQTLPVLESLLPAPDSETAP